MKTIEIGIDLGTTNSGVAVAAADGVQIVKNALGQETTPSVVFADRGGNIIVGSKAKRKLVDDASTASLSNGRAEVKRLMGTNEKLFFPNLVNRQLTPEEVSSEILKSLRNDVIRKYPNINADAAVITIPAHFSTVQSEATKRAGHLAGFKQTVLLQEPIAAAIAYGFLNQKNENWMIYDLGGGTFDVALVALRDGSLTVLAHAGDNFLGGKDIDSSIVDGCIIPFLESKKVNLNSHLHSAAYTRVRLLAEQAKIELTSSPKTTMDLDLEIDGNNISLQFELTRDALRAVCTNIFHRTTQLCKKTISESRVSSKSITRLVLVGGPTQMPFLRSYLQESLNLEVDGSLDPLTAVAQGAAQFARQIPISTKTESYSEEIRTSEGPNCSIVLNYEHATSSNMQTITGKINATTSTCEQPHSICLQTKDGSFTSGDLFLKNGKFACQVPTGKDGNAFWIYVKSSSGNLLQSDPDSFSISRGLSISGSPIPHSVGVSVVALSAEKGFSSGEENMDYFFKKNSILPLKETKRFFTVRDLTVGSAENALPIRVYEGESNIPDRNTPVCDLTLTGAMVQKDLPKHSPVDITISINESRELEVIAYLPRIDLTLNARATIYEAEADIKQINSSLSEQRKRSDKLNDASPESKADVKDLITDIEETINRSSADSDQKRKAASQVRQLMVALDDIEAKSKFEANGKRYYELVQKITEYLADARPAEKQIEYAETFDLIKREGSEALNAKDGVALQQVLEKMTNFHFQCLSVDPKFWLDLFSDLKNSNADKLNEVEISKLVQQCDKAITENSVDGLRIGVFALLDALNESAADTFKHLKSGIIR